MVRRLVRQSPPRHAGDGGARKICIRARRSAGDGGVSAGHPAIVPPPRWWIPNREPTDDIAVALGPNPEPTDEIVAALGPPLLLAGLT